jgi:hypothetical protein
LIVLTKFFKFFLHRREFPVISSLRTNSSGISGIQLPEARSAQPARSG